MVRRKHEMSPRELSRALEAERAGHPFLAFRDGAGELVIMTLGRRRAVTVGRLAGNALALEWDGEVSRAHAVIERVGGRWTAVDDGLSRNGTFLNGRRLRSRSPLADGDALRFGLTEVVFRNPGEAGAATEPPSWGEPPEVTPGQLRVLAALCAPLGEPDILPAPASNREIAERLGISVDSVRTHMRALFERFEVPELPQVRKRSELARRALQRGVLEEG
jgi:hypothetical protein